MTWDQIENDWKDFKEQAKEKWVKLSDADLDIIAGKKSRLSEQLQAKYGVTQQEVEKQLREFLNSNEKEKNAYHDEGGEGGGSTSC